MLRAILFDLDGTLIDTDPIHFIAWQELLRNYGQEINQTFYQTKISGRLNSAIIQEILPQLSAEEGRRIADEKEAYFRRYAGGLQAMAGFSQLWNWLKQAGLKTALVTNAPPANVHFMLQLLGMTEAFDELILAETLPVGKPDPAPYLLALKRLGVSAYQSLAFEDSASGIRSAVASGIFTVGVTSTLKSEDLLSLGASLTVSDFQDGELWRILQG